MLRGQGSWRIPATSTRQLIGIPRWGRHRSWELPPMLRLCGYAMGIVVAASLGARDDVEALYDLLLPHRSRHVVGGAGTAMYLGPVELYLGIAAAVLARVGEAVDQLSTAL